MARQMAIEAYVDKLADALQKSLAQQVTMQRQITNLTARLDLYESANSFLPEFAAVSEPAVKRQRSDDSQQEDSEEFPADEEYTEDFKWEGLTQPDPEALAEFAEVDLPSDIDQILSPRSRQQQVKVEEPLPQKPQNLPPHLTAHPLQAPRPSSLFNIYG